MSYPWLMEPSMSQRPALTVSEAARVLGLSADRVRQLERCGVLLSTRTASGMRLFDPAAVERLAAERCIADRRRGTARDARGALQGQTRRA